MPSKLSLLVPYMADELPIDFCARLAIRNFRSASIFAADMGFDLRTLGRSGGDAMIRLADLSGVPLSSLQDAAVRRVGKRYFYHEEVLNSGSVRRGHFAVCPECLKEDIQTSTLPAAAAIRHRSHWMAASISVCVKHHLVLANVGARKCGNMPRDWSHIAPSLVSQLTQIGKASVQRIPTPFESYLFDRLAGNSPGYWIDGLDFFVAERTARAFGLVASEGTKANTAKWTDAQLSAADNVGFQIIRDGEPGICAFLSDVSREFQREQRSKWKRSHTPASLYGLIYKRLYTTAHIPEFAKIHKVVADHILSNFPVGPGELIFQKPVGERRFHSTYTLSKQLKVSVKRVTNVLTAGGLLPSPGCSDNDAVVDAAKAETLMQAEMSGISQNSAERHLKIVKHSMETLIAHRLVSRHRHSTGVKGYRFFRSELDQFLQRLMEGAVPISPADVGTYRKIREASPFCRCTTVRIVELILDRTLRKICYLAGSMGFDSILVDPGEINGLFGRSEALTLSAVEAAAKLRTDPRVIFGLVERKLLDASYVKNRMSGRVGVRFTELAIDQFNAQFVSLFHLAREARRSGRRLKRELEAKGVLPAKQTDGLIVTFYRRADLPDF